MNTHFGIGSSVSWASVEPVDKGWSSDRKYRVTTRSGEALLLRLSDIGRYEEKRREYRIIQRFSRLGFAMSTPVEFGVCEDGRSAYMLLGWVEGRDLEAALPELCKREQYLLGRQAGDILKRIHAVPLLPEETPLATKREKKLRQLSEYEASGLRIPNDVGAIRYVKENIQQICRMPPACLHGDFHPGNLIYREGGDLGVIDFNRWEIGDPYEEFYKLESFGVEVSEPYCVGQIDGYFDDRVPMDFWRANAVYVAQASLFSIKWAERFGQADVDGMVRRAQRAFADFDHFRRIVPAWYSGEYRARYAPDSD